jgi:hypothetical protein
MNAGGSFIAVGLNAAAPIAIGAINAVGIVSIAGVNAIGIFGIGGVNVIASHEPIAGAIGLTAYGITRLVHGIVTHPALSFSSTPLPDSDGELGALPPAFSGWVHVENARVTDASTAVLTADGAELTVSLDVERARALRHRRGEARFAVRLRSDMADAADADYRSPATSFRLVVEEVTFLPATPSWFRRVPLGVRFAAIGSLVVAIALVAFRTLR